MLDPWGIRFISVCQKRRFAMKIRIVSILVVVIFCLGIGSAYAQEVPRDQLYFCIDTTVKPSRAADYEANCKKLTAEYAKHNFKFPWYAYSSNDFHYFFVFPINSLADMDAMAKEGTEMMNKIGKENFDKLWDGYGGTFDNRRDYFLTHIADLSHTPEKPRVKIEEGKFIIWRAYYIKSDMVKEAEDVTKELIALRKSKNIANGVNVLKGGLGADTPIHISEEWALSASDYYQNMEKDNAVLGEEFSAIWQKVLKVTRKYEERQGVYRADLSYAPKKE